jgi:hypothetical protein
MKLRDIPAYTQDAQVPFRWNFVAFLQCYPQLSLCGFYFISAMQNAMKQRSFKTTSSAT